MASIQAKPLKLAPTVAINVLVLFARFTSGIDALTIAVNVCATDVNKGTE